ncbi:MAG: RecQ family ATP-dependent DNA helicase [PVC group bacterium]
MKDEALRYLRIALDDPAAGFRPGQWEYIQSLLRRERLLLVQRTGWGKSMVYFLATRLLRNAGAGVTLLISPLLALMRNQILAADRLAVKAATINSSNRDDWEEVKDRLLKDDVDILLISPERLANDDFRENMLLPVADRIGLFVVDEAHCISDWGHDFRPDYRRIVRVLQILPSNIPVLATTATANTRVVNDVAAQLGNLNVGRGPLVRKSLKLQNIWLPGQPARLAWLAEQVPNLPGSGVIYTLTIRDAERVAAWLQLKGINAIAYHSRVDGTEKATGRREELEQMLINNEIKALVATVALGMGFDKPDLGFVIHFQRPGSVVHYYQQVGRAGRAVDEAYGILLSGHEDKDITDYFIRTAFPPQAHVSLVLRALNEADDGLSVIMLQKKLNLTWRDIEKVLKLLSVESPSPVDKQGPRWHATPIEYHLDTKRIEQLCKLRQAEQLEMLEYMKTTRCLMQFLAQALDDPSPQECGKCANCIGAPLLPESITPEIANQAGLFLRRSHQEISPRKQWKAGALENYGFCGKITDDLMAQPGRALSLWGDAGWGEMVRDGKYSAGRFPDDLIDGCLQMIEEWKPDPFPTWLTCVPSIKHPELVPDFTARLAGQLHIPFIPCVRKLKENRPQKEMLNSFQQARNLDGVFGIDNDSSMPKGPVFLVDDMVDSRWTFTVISALLRRAGCPAVFPLALALNTL